MQVIIRSQIYTHVLVSWLKHTSAALPGERRARQWQVSSISVWINWFLLHSLEEDALFIPLLLCVCECGRLLLLLRVSLKRAFLENGPRWQETSQGGTLQVCMSQHVGSLAEEADALIKSYLEPLLIVPSGVSSLTSYHTHPRVGHALDYVCVHQCWEGYF